MTAFDIPDVSGRDAERGGEGRLGEALGLPKGDEAGFIHDLISHNARLDARDYPRKYARDAENPSAQIARMGKKAAKKSANHLRAWREFRGMTQEELAEKVGTAGNVIGLIESGERGLSQKWLDKLAPTLGTRPGFLLEFDPNDVDRDMHEIIFEMPAENKALARQLLESLRVRQKA